MSEERYFVAPGCRGLYGCEWEVFDRENPQTYNKVGFDVVCGCGLQRDAEMIAASLNQTQPKEGTNE